MSRRAVLIVSSLLALIGSGTLVGVEVVLAVKAQVAGVLIERAYLAHVEDGGVHPPWSWADTHPVARLEVPRLGVERTVLAGASGSSLAFGPGHIDGTGVPGETGNCVIAGHRDTWFSFLGDLREGDAVLLETHDGTRRYEVRGLRVTTMWDAAVLEPSPEHRLTLVTCYPLDGLTPGPARLVVDCIGSG